MEITVRQQLVDQIRRHEGTRPKPYVDTVGKITIGVGRNLTDVGLSAAEILMLLDHDLDAVLTDLASFPWFPGLDSVRQRAVADFRFNVGGGTFRTFSKFLHAMAAGKYPDAANELKDSTWATQVGLRGRVLVDMIATGTE